ncbi:MAG: hypothetical protein JO352_33395 [Chloroflexi bacterium]|nr:hypothetical protein [Chloroflexota bacterium]MBV9598346.1 hypothetical protein [Chloroflexota bacterium]
MSGLHLVVVVAMVLAAVSVDATEQYTSRYHSLPVIDWLESRPPLTDSADLPSAIDLARDVSRALPLLVIRNDARTQMPVFGPPSSVQRVVGGVRDAARIDLGTPGSFPADAVPVTARLDVLVFDREPRADAWAQLMGRAMDIRDPDSGLPQVRTAGPEEADVVWLAAPGSNPAGIATVVGHRGAVAFELQVSFRPSGHASAAQLIDLSARAEVLARGAAAVWANGLTPSG